MEEVEGLLRGNEKEAGVLHHALGLEVQAQPGVIESVGDVVVELAVLLVGDLALRSRPERRRRVQRFVRLVLLFRLQHHWHGDVVGIGMDDLAQPRGVEVLLLPFAKMQRSEEHTSELQSLMRISYAVFCLNKTKIRTQKP